MSKYNEYARRLDKAFREVTTGFHALYTAVDREKKNVGQYGNRWGDAAFNAKRHAAEAKLSEAKANLEQGGGDLLHQFDTTLRELDASLRAAIAADTAVVPSDIDTNALELMKSGIMTAADYEQMVERFGENSHSYGNNTMLRLIGKYASEAATAMGDENSAERTRLNVIAMKASKNFAGVLNEWEGLMNTAHYIARRTPGSASFCEAMEANWGQEAIQAAIENF